MLAKLLPVCFLLGCGANPYIEYEHISAIRDGVPFNDRHSDQTDQVFVGLNFKGERCYLDLSMGVSLSSSELSGRDPFGRAQTGCYLFVEEP